MQPALCEKKSSPTEMQSSRATSPSKSSCAVKSAVLRNVVDIRRTRDQYMVFRQDGTWYVTESLSPIFHQTLDIVTEQGTMLLLPIERDQAEALSLATKPLFVELHSGGARLTSHDEVIYESRRVYSLNADSTFYRMR